MTKIGRMTSAVTRSFHTSQQQDAVGIPDDRRHVAVLSIPDFGKFVVGVVGLMLALVVMCALWLLIAHHEQAAEREAAKARIRKSEIELVDLRMGRRYGDSFNLGGRVRNRSALHAQRTDAQSHDERRC